MNGNNHLVFGTAVSVSTILALEQISTILPKINPTSETATLLVLGSIVGSLLPDIDNPTSHVGKLTIPISSVFKKLGKFAGRTKEKHRWLMHEPFGYILLLFYSYFYFPHILGLILGVISHLWLDLFNPSGIPILFGAKHIRLGKLKSGSKASEIFTWINAIFILVIGIILKIIKIEPSLLDYLN